jgi:hypothetical protein
VPAYNSGLAALKRPPSRKPLWVSGANKHSADKMDNPDKEHKGIIGRYYEGTLPVIVKFVNELPAIDTQKQLTSLTVVSWKYDGSSNNGMPTKEINEKMITLESALEKTMDESKSFVHAYSRTGNDLKEFVYYCKGMDEFMPLLNETLQSHERYPIDIDFYEDPEWMELKKLIEDFKKK